MSIQGCFGSNVRVAFAVFVGVSSLVALLSCFDPESESSTALACTASTAEELQDALDNCSEVTLTSSVVYEGNFVMPAGTSIEGNGATIQGSTDDAVFRITGGMSAERPTRLAGVQINHGGLGVLSQGSGFVELEGVDFFPSALGGAFFEGLDGLKLTDVMVDGTVDSNNVASVGSNLNINPREVPIVGVLINEVRNVEASNLSIQQIAGFGAIFRESQSTWMEGGVREWVGTGVLVEGGSMRMESLSVADSLRAPELVIVPNGVVATSGAMLTTTDITIDNIIGYGLLQDQACSAHTNITVTMAAKAGIWVQNTNDDETPALMIHGDSRIADNRGLSIFLREFTGLDIEDATIADAVARTDIFGESGRIRVGDGIQTVGPAGMIRVQNTLLTGHSRAGWILDGQRTSEGTQVEFDVGGVEVNQGEQDVNEDLEIFGFVNQSGSDEIGLIIETGLRKSDELAAQDEQRTESLGVVPVFREVINLNAITSVNESLVDGLVTESGQLMVEEGGGTEDIGLIIENGL